jgi:hypothetical protein
VRWGDKVCPQCGGDLYADYADIALACLKCGYHEPPPRPGKSHARRSAKRPFPPESRPVRRAPASPLVALVEVRPGSRRLIEGVCVAHGCKVVCFSPAPSSVDEVVAAGAELLIIEADRGGLAVALAHRLRAQAPAIPIAVVLPSWSESEPEARSTAEFVIHAPLRESEVKGVLEVMESYGGWLPAPLLAATYRARVAN